MNQKNINILLNCMLNNMHYDILLHVVHQGDNPHLLVFDRNQGAKPGVRMVILSLLPFLD